MFIISLCAFVFWFPTLFVCWFCFACCLQSHICAFLKAIDSCSHSDADMLLLLLFLWLQTPTHILRPTSSYSFHSGSHKLIFHPETNQLLFLLPWQPQASSSFLMPITSYSCCPGGHRLRHPSWCIRSPIPAVVVATGYFSLLDAYNLIFLPSYRPQAPAFSLMSKTSDSWLLYGNRLLLPSWVQQTPVSYFLLNRRLSPTMKYSVLIQTITIILL